jgi:hypothetical protein
VVNVWDDCSVDILASKTIYVASAVENDAGIYEPGWVVCCCKSAVVALIHVQYVNNVVL